MEKVSIGMIGAGFAARLHGNSFKYISGLNLDLVSIADIRIESAKELAEIYGYTKYTNNYKDILNDEEVDVVILATPPSTHFNMILDALDAGKHVICEKPLTGYFGMEDDEIPIGLKVPKERMYERVKKDLENLHNYIVKSDKRFMYAENYIYSPNIQKAAEIIRKKQSTILFMKGEESVQGSPSIDAGYWNKMGGGSLLRIGSHPLAGILYLKDVEAKTKGKEIRVKSLIADTGRVSPNLNPQERKYLRSNPIDVEDFGTITLTFTDDTKATIFANDNVLGGVKNYIEIYSNDSTMICNITPSDELKTYFLDEKGLDEVYISEQLEHKTGWNNVFVSESIQRGYIPQMQDFLECVAYDREPLSNFELAREVTRILYAAYVSASKGMRVYI